MDLNKDNQDIYTVDRDSYSKYMQDSWTGSKDLLGSFIKFLLFVLLIVISYFFYKIVKADLSFSEVFNKKELLSTYELFETNENSKYIEKESVIVELDIVEEQKQEIKVEVVVPIVVKVMPSEVKINKEESELNVLSDSYLERMVEELNSI